MYKLANLGMAGMVASTGLSSYHGGGGTAYGEEFVNSYIANLVDGSEYSDWFGQAFLDAKRNYDHGWLWDKTDKKTMLEYVYYGLPWSFMETPDNQAGAVLADREPKGYNVSSSEFQIADASYSKVFTTTISTYQFTPVDGFELLEIPGTEYLYTFQEPVLPYVLTTLNLPPGTTVSDIQLISEHSTALGQHNIPAADPATMYNPTTGYTSTMGVSGDYPTTRYTYEVTDYPDRTEVRIGIAPAVFNVETQNVTMYDETVLKIIYDASVPVLVYNLDFAPEYRRDESIDATSTVENVGASAKTLTAVLNIYDESGGLMGTLTTSPFTVSAGEAYELPLSWTGSLPHGSYNATLAVYETGTRLASAPGLFSVSAGSIRAFDVPTSIRIGEYGNFSLTFANYQSSAVSVIADVFVYDRNGIQVAKLLQRSFWVGAQSEGTTNWLWNPENLNTGDYAVEAVVTVDGKVYNSPSQSLSVMGEHTAVYLPIVLKNYTPGSQPPTPPNNPPNTPSNPSPSDGALDQSVNVDLSWTGGEPDPGDSVTYDVYFEANDSTPDVLICNDEASAFCDPGTLSYGTPYYWQVVARDSHGATTMGPVWDFTTATAPVTGWQEVGTGSATSGGISDNSGDSRRPSLAIAPAPDGTPYVTWYDDGGGDWEIYVRRWIE